MTTPAATRLLRVPGGRLEYLVTGSGEPVTLFVPGLGGGIPDTRPLGSGVPGTKVFLQDAGRDPARWRYADLAADLAVAADEFQATRVLGVSLGAGALCRLLADHPARFERVVCFLPAVLDAPRAVVARSRLRDVAAAIATGSPDAVAEVLSRELPPQLRDTRDARQFAAQRAHHLIVGGTDVSGAAALAAAVAGLADDVAVPEPSALRRVTAAALVIGCRGDDLHPVEVAEQLAGALPDATLHVYDDPAPLWTHRADLRKRISGWFGYGRPTGLA